MSGRAASHSLNRRNSRLSNLLLIASLFAVSVLVALLPGSRAIGADDPLAADNSDTLPPTEPQRVALALKYQIPNRKSAVFTGRRDPKTGFLEGGIQDFEAMVNETKNPDEYQAWHAVISHAKQFTNAELEQNAGRDLTRDDFLNPPRFTYRLDLFRFDGKLTRVRWAAATKSLREAGTPEVYEALIVPFDEPMPVDKPSPYVISIVFTDLPADLAAVKQKPAGEWMDVNAEATAAGYFFKVKQDAAGHDPIPLLIGRSISVRKPSPNGAVPGVENPMLLDKSLRVFQKIRDNSYIAKADENWEELSAWNRVLLHSRRFMPEDLEKAATEVKFADLFLDNRRDYKLDLVKFEGRLIMLTKNDKPTDKLLAAGINTMYEGWIVPKDTPGGHPVCVVFTDPPEGVEPVGRVNKWVSFAGYSFKLMWYKSGERDKDDPNKQKAKKAPLILGRAVIDRPDPDAVSSTLTWSAFLNTVLIAGGIVVGLAAGITFWFRRGDKRVRQEIESHRVKNPFGEPGSNVG